MSCSIPTASVHKPTELAKFKELIIADVLSLRHAAARQWVSESQNTYVEP